MTLQNIGRFLQDRSISIKVLLSPFILVLTLGLVVWLAVYGLNLQAAALNEVNDIALERMTLIEEFTVLSEQVQSDVFRIAVLEFMDLPPEEVEPVQARLEQGLSDLNVIYGQMLTRWPLNPTERAILERMKGPMDQFRQQARQAADVVADNPAFGVLLVRSTTAPFAEFRQALAEFSASQAARIARARTASRQGADIVRGAMIVIALVIGLGGVLLTSSIGARLIAGPIRTMTDLMDRLARGELAVEVDYLKRRDEIGAMARAVEVFRQNAVEKARLDEALQESERMLSTLMSNLPGIAYRCRNNRAWTMEFISEGCLELTGYPAADLILDKRVTFSQLIHPDDRETVWQKTQTALQQDERYQLIYRLITATGEEKWVWEQGAHTSTRPQDESLLEGFITDITDKHLAEAALKRQKEILQKIFDHIPIMIALFDADYRFQLVNREWERVMGWQLAEIQGRNMFVELYPDPTERQEVLDFVQSRPTRWRETRETVRDGRELDLTWINVWLSDDSCIGIGQDITQRKQAEKALREKESLLREMSRLAKLGAWEFDVETGRGNWTEEAARIHDLEPDEPASVEFGLSFYQGHSRRQIELAVAEAIERGKPYDLELELVTARGNHKWVRAIGHPLWQGEQVVKVRGTFQDITELKQAQEELRISEERFALAVQGANDGLWDWDIAQQKLYWSPRLKELLGYTDDDLEIDFESFEALLHPDDRERTKAAIDAHLIERQSFCVEQRMQTKSGDYRWYSARGQAVWDEAGNPVRMVGFTSDITERKQMEDTLQAYSEQLAEMVEERTRELRAAQEQLVRREKLAVLGQLSGGLAHQLRNPLGNIKNAAYLLDLAKQPEPIVEEALAVLETEINRAERIISSLLDFARTKAPDRSRVDLASLLRQVAAQASLPDTPRIELVLGPADGLPPVLADPDQLNQVFDNLIVNAIQAMPDGGRLEITSTLREAAWVAVSVADTGVGIPPENLAKIFEPLVTTKAKGIGLGLALIQNLVEANGGRVKVESELGQGSTFTVKLPLANL